MSHLETLLLALGLAMDATAVAAAKGLASPRLRARDALLVCVLFGGFQALMPALGWLAGTGIGPWVQGYSRWIAFALLSLVGGKMLWEARHQEQESEEKSTDFSLPTLLFLAVATSLDALAVGITLPLVRAPLGRTVAVIGVVTAASSLAGLLLGRTLGARAGRRFDVLGGLVLLGIGLELLLARG